MVLCLPLYDDAFLFSLLHWPRLKAVQTNRSMWYHTRRSIAFVIDVGAVVAMFLAFMCFFEFVMLPPSPSTLPANSSSYPYIYQLFQHTYNIFRDYDMKSLFTLYDLNTWIQQYLIYTCYWIVAILSSLIAVQLCNLLFQEHPEKHQNRTIASRMVIYIYRVFRAMLLGAVALYIVAASFPTLSAVDGTIQAKLPKYPAPYHAIHEYVSPLRVVNSYGLFRS